MIKTKEELINSTANAAIVDTTLLIQLVKDGVTVIQAKDGVTISTLKALSESGKPTTVVTRDLLDSIVRQIAPKTDKMAPVRALRKSKGGRKRLPEPTAEEEANMSPENLLKLKNRRWQRDSRKKRGIGIPND